MKLLGLSGGPNQSSKTLIAITHALDFAKKHDKTISAECLNICEYDVQFCDARDPMKYEGDTKLVIDKIVQADALIIGTPMYRGTYTGILKNAFDLIPNDALLGKPVGLIATGGSYHHFLSLEHELKPILGFFQAHAIPGSVYAINEDYSGSKLIDQDVLSNLDRLARSVVDLCKITMDNKSKYIGAFGPSIRRSQPLKASNE